LQAQGASNSATVNGDSNDAYAYLGVGNLAHKSTFGAGFRKGSAPSRQKSVNAAPTALNWANPVSGRRNPAARKRWSGMSVVVFLLLTMAIFALLGLIQRLVERL
jgi:hypothetical protein